MAPDHLPEDVVVDFLRCAWIAERGRESVYARWQQREPRFEPRSARAAARARLVGEALRARSRGPDEHLVSAHARWIHGLVGDAAPDTALAEALLTRLGDWVEGLVVDLLEAEPAQAFTALGNEERASVHFPSELPPPPPFEPLETPEPELDPRFRLGVLGDLHIGSPAGETMARAAIADLNSSGAEFVVQLGDLTDHGDKDEFELAARILGELEAPHATMMGNHDVLSITEDRLAGREYYPASFGRPPDGLLLEHKGMRIAVLDSAEISTTPFGPFDLQTGTFARGRRGALTRGALTPPQHDILAEVAAPASPPAFLFLHHPPQPFTSFPPVLFGLRDEDTGRLHATCDSGNVWGIFTGHSHRNARTRTFGRVPAQEVAIPRDFPFGYALIDVVEDGYCYRFFQISDQELLRDAYARATLIHRRYGLGSQKERAFVWRKL